MQPIRLKSIILGALLFSFGAIFGGVTYFLSMNMNANSTTKSMSQKIIQPTIISTPTPVQPSDRALKIAAYFYTNIYTNAPKAQKKEYEEKWI